MILRPGLYNVKRKVHSRVRVHRSSLCGLLERKRKRKRRTRRRGEKEEEELSRRPQGLCIACFLLL